MAKLRDKPLRISFQDTPIVTVIVDPNVELVEKEGRNGPYDLLPVKLPDGRPALLPMSSTRLASQIQQLERSTKVTITRVGEGVNTTYTVKTV